MANIFPFRGIRYNEKQIRDLSKVVSPPYDIITDEEQDHFYRASPHNVIRIEFGKKFSKDNGSRNRYTRAKSFLTQWLRRGVLTQDAAPSIYIYEQKFRIGRKWKRRLGFIALLKLGENGSAVYPHERTFDLPKEDRLKLLQSLRTNTSPLFFLYPDRRERVKNRVERWTRRSRPLWAISFKEERHTLWRLSDPFVIDTLQALLSRKRLFIADGHHRFEVAKHFCGQEPDKNFVMAYFTNLFDANLTILPIHRLVKGLDSVGELERKLKKSFSFRTFRQSSELLQALEKTRKGYAFGMCRKREPFVLLTLKDPKALSALDRTVEASKIWKRLDVTVLHELILKRVLGLNEAQMARQICYSRDVKRCLRLIQKEEYQVGFFLRAPRIEQVQRIALAGEKMPQKSTYFYPKPLTGLVMYRFENGNVRSRH